MGPYARMALSVIRIAAAGLILLGMVQAGSLLFLKNQDIGLGTYLLKGWAAFAGLILFAFGGKIARALTRNLED